MSSMSRTSRKATVGHQLDKKASLLMCLDKVYNELVLLTALFMLGTLHLTLAKVRHARLRSAGPRAPTAHAQVSVMAKAQSPCRISMLGRQHLKAWWGKQVILTATLNLKPVHLWFDLLACCVRNRQRSQIRKSSRSLIPSARKSVA